MKKLILTALAAAIAQGAFAADQSGNASIGERCPLIYQPRQMMPAHGFDNDVRIFSGGKARSQCND